MKKNRPFLRILAGLVGGILAYALVGGMFEAGRSNSHLEFALVQVANDLNKKLPMMVDGQTRLDKVTSSSGSLTYFFSLPDLVNSNLHLGDFETELRPKLVENYKTNSASKALREQKVILAYEYKDKNGRVVFKTSISPKDF